MQEIDELNLFSSLSGSRLLDSGEFQRILSTMDLYGRRAVKSIHIEVVLEEVGKLRELNLPLNSSSRILVNSTHLEPVRKEVSELH